MSSRRRRKTSRTRRIDGTEVERRQAAEANAAFWYGSATATPPEQPDAAAGETADGGPIVEAPTARPPAIVTEVRRVSVTTDPTSTVRSLGKPPLAGREAAAEHYFEAVYHHAVAMAGALAAAGDLLTSDDEAITES